MQWCGHCKRLAPEYAKAAAKLKADGLRIAKVDATVSRDLASRFDVSGFPTLKFFRNGRPSDYGGGRTEDAIVGWVRKHSGPAAKKVSTVEEADAVIASADVAVLGFFDDEESAEFKAFFAMAEDFDDTPFAYTSSAAVRAAKEVSSGKNAVVLFKNFEEGRNDYEGDLVSVASMTSFVRSNSLPLVVKFTQESAPKIFNGGINVHHLLFINEEAENAKAVLTGFANVAKENKGRILFVQVGPDEQRIMSYFGITEEQTPTTVLVDMTSGNNMKKFAYPHGTDVTEDKVRAFVSAFSAGELKPHLKTEEAADDDLTGPVAVIRGKTFEEAVLKSGKDVLLEFYAPWCGHCKSLAPIYEQLGETVKSVPTLRIAKIDATANEIDHPAVNVRGFPTLYFFPDGKEPIEYDGSRDISGFLGFLKKHATHPVTVDAAEADEADDEL